MHVLITGGHGFIGSELASLLLREGVPVGPSEPAQPLTTPTLFDRAPDPDRRLNDARVRKVFGDAADPAMQTLVNGWPSRFDSELARRLGIVGDRSLPHVINRHLQTLSDDTGSGA